MNIAEKIKSGTDNSLEWSAVNLPMKGEEVSGDDFLIKSKGNQVLVAAIDGLGHGQEALHAAGKALESLRNFDNQSLIYLVNRCHDDLSGSRGVVMSMAVFDSSEDSMAWIGIGNVEGILFRANGDIKQNEETILLRGGVVGYKLPRLKASIVSVEPGDTLIFTTDGVSYEYGDQVKINQSTDKIVEFIASNYVDYTDDAQVVVARYTG